MNLQTIPIYNINSWPKAADQQIQLLAQHPEKFNSILIYLFDDCNMKCKFCVTNAEHRLNKVKFNESLFDKYLNDVQKCLPLMRLDGHYGLTLIGGELFLPKIPIKIYDDFISKLKKIVNPHCQLQIISNFLFDNPLEVANLIKKYNIKLDLSFDLVGRYTKPYMVPRVLQNVYTLIEQGITINVIMTNHKYNIDAIINKGENYSTFKELYDNPQIQIQLGEYIDMSLWLGYRDEWAPTIDQCIMFFKHIIDNYPQIKDVQQLIKNLNTGKLNEYRCGEIYISRDKIGYCTDDYIARRTTYITKQQCWVCKYFKCCSLVCYKGCVDFDQCWKKHAYDYLIVKGYSFNEK